LDAENILLIEAHYQFKVVSKHIVSTTLKKFPMFWSTYSVTTPFPVSETIPCYFSTYMWQCQGLSPQTIKVYLAGIWHIQILIGLPDPKEFTSIPCLHMIQSGIQWCVSEQDSRVTKIRFSITSTILKNAWLLASKVILIRHKDVIGYCHYLYFWIFSIRRNHSTKHHII